MNILRYLRSRREPKPQPFDPFDAYIVAVALRCPYSYSQVEHCAAMGKLYRYTPDQVAALISTHGPDQAYHLIAAGALT